MNYDDDFDDPKQAGIGAWIAERKSRLAGIALLCVLLFFVGLIWASYQSGGNAPGTLPTIAADTQPYKSAPDDPGGMDIANRDTTVFDALSPDNKPADDGAAPEDLFAKDDAVPADRDTAYFSGLKTDTAVPVKDAQDTEKDTQTKPEEKTAAAADVATPADKAPPSQEKLASVDAQPEAVPAPETEKADPVAPEEPAKAAPAPAAPVKQEPAKTPSTPLARDPSQLETAAGAAVASGSSYIQLASLPNAADAPAAWKKLQGEFASQLAGLSHRVVAVDIPGKGTFHRLQAGPTSADEAVKRCTAIKAVRAGACLVAR